MVRVATSQIDQSCLSTNKTSQRRLKQVRLIDVPVSTSWWRLSMIRDVPTYMRPKWDVATTSHAGWVKVYYGRFLRNRVYERYVNISKSRWDVQYLKKSSSYSILVERWKWNLMIKVFFWNLSFNIHTLSAFLLY